MSKHIILILAIIITANPVFFSSLLMAQSKSEGRRLFQEAVQLQKKAQSTDDMKRAVGKYEKALGIFEKVGELKGQLSAFNNLGIAYSDWGQYAKAVEYYEKGLEISTKLGGLGLKQEGIVLNHLGNTYRHLGQFQKAEEHHQKSLAIMRKFKDRKGEAQCLLSLGQLYEDLGQCNKAMACCYRSLATYRKLMNHKGEASSLNCLGTIHMHWGEYTKAMEKYEESMKIAERIGDVVGEMNVLGNQANLYWYRGKFQESIECSKKSIEISKKLGNLRAEGKALGNMGNVYSDWGKFQESLECSEKSLEISRKIGDPMEEAGCLTNSGIHHLGLGEYQKAAQFFQKSLEISKKLGALKLQAYTLVSLGNVYKIWGQYLRAVEHCEQALEISTGLSDRQGQQSALKYLGIVYSDWGQYEMAIERYKESLQISKMLGDPQAEADTLCQLGTAYARSAQYNDALNNLQKAVEIYEKIGVPHTWPDSEIGNLYLDTGQFQKAEPFIERAGNDASLGRMCLIKNDYKCAEEHYQNIVMSAEQNRDVDDLFAAYTGLGTVYEERGYEALAEDYFRKAATLVEDLRSSLSRAQRENFFGVRIGGFLRTAPYDGLARVSLKMHLSDEAFKHSEYIKSRVFAEAISKRSEESSFNIPVDVLKQDQELNDQTAALRKKRQEAYERGNQEVITVIEPQVQEMETRLQAHIEMLREKYPLFASTKYPEPMDIYQTALKNNEWVLAYHVTDRGIIIYLVRGIQMVEVLFKPMPRDALESLVRKFRGPLEMALVNNEDQEKQKESFDVAAGKKLSDLLLSGVIESLPRGVQVIVVPDDCLGALPFEALVLNEGGTIKTGKDRLPTVFGAEFFVDRNRISYCQSVTALTLARIRSEAKGTGAGLLVIADPIYETTEDAEAASAREPVRTGILSSLYKHLYRIAAEKKPLGGIDFHRLEQSGQFAEDLAEMYKSPSNLLCIRKHANKTNFLNNIAPSLDRYDKIVFATHGYFGKDLPGITEPALVLTLIPPGTDGYLRMTEVMGLNMSADIVALIACQTGLGKRTAGEGTMGMGRAFQYAGAKSVLMSLWSVSELASLNLMKKFFQNLKDGKSKLESLALAREEIRKEGFDHPYFWAGFILVGEAN